MALTASRSADRRTRTRTGRLDLPAAGRTALLPRLDQERVSRGAETVARFLGTGHYLAIQTGVVIVWISLNIAMPLLRWDPYPFILLNLAFSTQAAYAAPLILLAQNRQDDRDRASLTEDRAVAVRMREDTEFLTREVAGLRLAQSEAATRQYVRGELAGQLESLRDDLEALLLDVVRAQHQPVTVAMPTQPVDTARETAEAADSAGLAGDTGEHRIQTAKRARTSRRTARPATVSSSLRAEAVARPAPQPDAAALTAESDDAPRSRAELPWGAVPADDADAQPGPADQRPPRADAHSATPHRPARTAAGRGHHRPGAHAGAARRSTERAKSGESSGIETHPRHV